MAFFLRTFIYAAAFIGAGWFGLWVYSAVQQSGWSTVVHDAGFDAIVIAGAVGGVLAALLNKRG